MNIPGIKKQRMLFYPGFRKIESYRTKIHFNLAQNCFMKKKVEVDDKLLSVARKMNPRKTESEIVNAALRKFISYAQAAKTFLNLRGKVKWEGNLDEMRNW